MAAEIDPRLSSHYLADDFEYSFIKHCFSESKEKSHDVDLTCTIFKVRSHNRIKTFCKREKIRKNVFRK